MKRAKVSSVYEGRKGMRSKEEKECSSRRARMTAIKARKKCSQKSPNHGKPHSFVIIKKTTKSSISLIKSKVEKKKKKNEEEEICMVEEEKIKMDNKNIISDDNPKIDHSGAIAEASRGEMLEKWGEGPVWWEEYWPYLMILSWNFQQENCRPYWDVMDGGAMSKFLADQQDHEEEPCGDIDIWNLRDIKQVPKA